MDWGIDLMDKLKLKWKIFAFLLGFSALLLLVLWIFQTVFLSDMYKFVRNTQVERAISLVGKNINKPSLEDVLSELELTKEIVVRPTEGFFPPVQHNMMKRFGRRGAETITKVEDFVLEDGSEISLTFYALVTPVDATVSTLRMQLLLITGIMIILSILLATIISKHIAKPIEKINKSTKKLAMGDYEAEFNARGFLEIKELSDTLNITAKELSKVEDFRRELMANISHDLRTPLAIMYSYAEMMHDFPNEITAEQSQVIMDETKRLTSLVNDILHISNFEIGIAKLNKVKFNLTESLEKTIDRMRELLKKEAYHLEFEHSEVAFVLADEVKITQAFYNLLLNAVTHSGDKKIIIVRQRVEEDIVRIEVIDKGEGIKKSDLPYIWERYYKVEKTHNRPITGTGLGLSIVKKIIHMHGGDYGVESEIGKGSIFWFSLNKMNDKEQKNSPM